MKKRVIFSHNTTHIMESRSFMDLMNIQIMRQWQRDSTHHHHPKCRQPKKKRSTTLLYTINQRRNLHKIKNQLRRTLNSNMITKDQHNSNFTQASHRNEYISNPHETNSFNLLKICTNEADLCLIKAGLHSDFTLRLRIFQFLAKLQPQLNQKLPTAYENEKSREIGSNAHETIPFKLLKIRTNQSRITIRFQITPSNPSSFWQN